MRSLLDAIQPTLDRIGHVSAAVARSSNRTVALSLMLLAASSVSVWATANTPPHNLSVSLSQTVVDEGQSVTLTGSFTDPDAADLHSVNVNWKDGKPQQKVQLPAGQTTFSVTHVYPDNFPNYPTYPTRTLMVSVADKDAAAGPNDNAGGEDHWDAQSIQLELHNVAPSFAHTISVQKVAGKPGVVVVEGDVTDPGADTFEVSAKWGDGPQIQLNPYQPCTTAKRHFKCEHTYKPAQVRGYSVELRVKDDDGSVGKTTVQVPMP